MLWLGVLLVLLHPQFSATAINFANNACPDLNDYPLRFLNSRCYENPDVDCETPDCITRHGYPVEMHPVVTWDGYILNQFRIPPKKDDCRKNKQPIMLQHSYGFDASVFVNSGNRSLAFRLADEGYDVWLPSYRGTPYSMGHKTLDASDPRYWDFSLDELQIWDTWLCAVNLKNVTKKNSDLIYLAHGFSSTILMIHLARNRASAPSFLRGMVPIEPYIYFEVADYMKPVLAAAPLLIKMLQRMGFVALFFNQKQTRHYLQFTCTLMPSVCRSAIDYIFGPSHQIAPEDLLKIFSNFPRIVSLRVLDHIVQIMTTGVLKNYDFGPEINMQKYNQSTPPLYDLSQIELPIYMPYGLNDNLITPKSVAKTVSQLGSKIKRAYTVPIGNNKSSDQFDSIDFLVAPKLNKFFIDDLLHLFKTELGPVAQC